MIYFIANWRPSKTNLEENHLLHVIRKFIVSERQHRVLTLNYSPFSRYQMQEATILSENSMSLFDYIQNIKKRMGHPMTLDDVFLPSDVERLYHPTGITLVRKNTTYGEVYFNQYGCMEKIHYFKKYGGKTDYYDDRGFLSSREFFDTQEQLVKREYFNEQERLTLTEHLIGTPKVIVEKDGNKQLPEEAMQTIHALIGFVLTDFLADLKEKEDHAIMEFDASIHQLLRENDVSQKLIQMIPEASSFDSLPVETQRQIIRESEGIVTNTSKKKEILEQIKSEDPELTEKEIFFIPMFHTELRLGNSNSVPLLIMYLKITDLTDENQTLYRMLIKKVIEKEEYSLLTQVKNFEDQERLSNLHFEIINEHYHVDHRSEDYEKVEKFITAKKEMKLFDTDKKAVEGLRKTAEWTKLVAAVETVERLEFLVTPSPNKTRGALGQARIFIDIHSINDLRMQSLVVSAGIPMIIKEKTDYLSNKKNGQVVQSVPEALEAVEYFLDSLDHWNHSLIESVDIIKKNSIEETMKKWRRAFNE
ncbi:accessory Sec system protein Asp1 [Enterococcus sp. LJL98]